MKRPLQIALACSAASILAISAAQAETKTYDFDGFTIVKAAAGVDVEITVGGAYSVRAEGDPKQLEKLKMQLSGDTLKIARKRSGGWFQNNRRSDFTIYITTPVLEGVEVSSGAEVNADAIDAGEFRASVSSGADASLSGRCAMIDASASTGADLDAAELQCETANASVSTGADLRLYASSSIKASASTGGDITVYGGPSITEIDKSTGGDVTVRN